jgi:LysM repeat protein
MKITSLLSLLACLGLIACASEPKTVRSGSRGSTSDLPTPANEPLPAKSEPMPTPEPVAASSNSAPAESTPVATIDYEVKSGDSLWKIAHDHKTSVKKIKALNNLTSDALHPGQKLKVPQP